MRKTKDSAVSPVIGVLLMLVVTIIIAAVVSGFAGGLAGTQQKAPQASLMIKTGWVVKDDGSIDSNSYDFAIEHKGGDPIMTKDTQLITYLSLVNGTVIKHVQTPTSDPVCGVYWGSTSCSRVPHLYDNQKYGFPCGAADLNSPAWFGTATWMPGDLARTYRLHFTAGLFGVTDDELKSSIGNHTSVEVKLLHVPSGKSILDQKVNLQ